MSVVNYQTTSGANTLKNWELMTKPCPVKLTKKNFWTWIQYIRIQADVFDWKDILKVPKGPLPPTPLPSPGGTVQQVQDTRAIFDLITKFNQVSLEDVIRERDVRVNKNDDILTTQTKALNVWLQMSCDNQLQRHLTKNHATI